MKNQIIWISSAAGFSVIGLVAAYLTNPSYTFIGALIGMVAGVGVAALALAGEKNG